MAVGWTFIFRRSWLLGLDLFLRGSLFSARTIDHPASHKSLGGERIPNVGASFHTTSITTPDVHHDLDAKLIAWNHLTSKPGALNSGEQHQFAVAVLDFGEEQNPTSLGHSLHDEDTWHHREARKVSGKERFVDRDVLDSDNPFPALKIDDPVNEQKRKTVREDAPDVIDVQRSLGLHGSVSCRLSSVGHQFSLSMKSERWRAKIILYRAFPNPCRKGWHA